MLLFGASIVFFVLIIFAGVGAAGAVLSSPLRRGGSILVNLLALKEAADIASGNNKNDIVSDVLGKLITHRL